MRLIFFIRSWLFLLFLGATAGLAYSSQSAGSGSKEDRPELPSGNYQEKCWHCKVDDDNLLTCKCPVKSEKHRTKGRLRSLDMNSCNRWAAKREGSDFHLVCDEQYASDAPPKFDNSKDEPELLENSEGLPPGSYRYFCYQCTLSASNQLDCSCMAPGQLGLLTRPYLDLNSCTSLDHISYVRGKLYCDNKKMLNALGPFIKSCRNCVIKAGSLQCLCDKTHCDWSPSDLAAKRNLQWTVLEDFGYCSSKVINCNGFLRCGECNYLDFFDQWFRPVEGHASTKSCDGVIEYVKDWFFGE